MITTTGATPTREIDALFAIAMSGAGTQVPAGESLTAGFATRTGEKEDERTSFVNRLIPWFSSWTGEGSGRLVVSAVGMLTVAYTPSAVLLESPLVGHTAHSRPASRNTVGPTIQDARAVAAEPHAESVRWLRDATGLPLARIGRLIGVSRMTLNSWTRGGAITDSNRRRVLAIRQIVELATRRHQGPSRIAAWLDTPRGASGQTPFDLLVAGDLDQARYLAVSEPSPNLSRAPSWAYRPLRRDEEARGEHVGEALPNVPEADLSETDGDSQDDEWETVRDR